MTNRRRAIIGIIAASTSLGPALAQLPGQALQGPGPLGWPSTIPQPSNSPAIDVPSLPPLPSQIWVTNTTSGNAGKLIQTLTGSNRQAGRDFTFVQGDPRTFAGGPAEKELRQTGAVGIYLVTGQ